jgi:DNA-binding transcriptional LysR family regulator
MAACQHIIPPVLREFKESFPDHAITIAPGDTPELVPLLLRHKIDLALTLRAEKDRLLDFHPLFTDELQFIVGATHPWAQAGRVERSEIPRQNYTKPGSLHRLDTPIKAVVGFCYHQGRKWAGSASNTPRATNSINRCPEDTTTLR